MFKLFSPPITKHFPVEHLSAKQLPVNIQPLLACYIHARRNNESPLTTIKQSKIICSQAYNNGYWPNQKATPTQSAFKIVPASLPSDRKSSCSGSQTNTTCTVPSNPVIQVTYILQWHPNYSDIGMLWFPPQLHTSYSTVYLMGMQLGFRISAYYSIGMPW